MKKVIICILVAHALLAASSCSRSVGVVEVTKTPNKEVQEFDEPQESPVPAKTESQGGQDNKTNKPSLIGSAFLAKDRYCIAGNAPNRAVITIEGALQPVETKAIDGLFVAEVFLEAQKSNDVELRIYAQSSGEDISDPLIITVGKNDPRGNIPVYVGKKNHLHYEYTLDDFLGINLFSELELERLRGGAEKIQQKLIDEGLKTELIIYIAPNHATIYPETMPDFLTERKTGSNSRAKQMEKEFEGSAVKLIFPYKRLLAEKSNYMLYYLADTHWNELGAYFGYCELFEYIGESFPDAKPLSMFDLDIYDTTMYGGDIISNMLFFDSYAYTSTTTIARVKNPKAVLTESRGDAGHGFEIWVNNDGKDRPTLMIYRDSFSVAMISPIAETAGKVIINPMWEFKLDMDYIKEVNPDYLIVEKVERETRGFFEIFR